MPSRTICRRCVVVVERYGGGLLYHKLINKRVKIVSRDGDVVTVCEGILKEYDNDHEMLLIADERKDRDIYLSTKTIQKLEVLEAEKEVGA